MRGHSTNELQYYGQVLDSDGSTVLSGNVPCGVSDLTGHVREQIQLSSPETTHRVVMYGADGAGVKESGFLNIDGTLYVIDYKTDPRIPRPGMWTEIYCHVQRTN